MADAAVGGVDAAADAVAETDAAADGVADAVVAVVVDAVVVAAGVVAAGGSWPLLSVFVQASREAPARAKTRARASSMRPEHTSNEVGWASMERTLVELLAAKRDGATLRGEEIARLVASFVDGTLADYQMAAFLMAVFFRGLDDAETVALTEAMLHSGTVLDLSSVAGTKVDKHSTGGVGDKVSICLAPLVAACGVPVPMVSGRGLGHTGGTLDKLEAIPGFKTDLPVADFARIVGDVGTCMIGQTKEIAPADKRIYALRDVTATVESIPLIVASILSKKLAEGIDGLVLDVKVGKGAFMRTHDSARQLADKLVRVGTRAGKKVVAVLTRMDAPLGRAVGNANETREAIDVLHGRGPRDLVECTLVLGAEMLVLGGRATDVADGRAKLEAAIASGAGARAMEKMIDAQHGDPRVVEDPARLEVAEAIFDARAPHNGYVVDIDALEIGLTAVAMGAGRTRADQKVDPAVGIEIAKKPGDAVRAGDVVARVFVREETAGEAFAARVSAAFGYAEGPPSLRALVVDRITA